MEAVFGLLPDDRAPAVEDLGADLLARMGREAVHDDRPLGGEREQVGVELVGGEGGAAPLGLSGVIAEAYPDVGIERIGAVGGRPRGRR